MIYSVDVAREIDAFASVIERVNLKLMELENRYDWRITVNAGGIEYGVYLNFNLDRTEIEISNQPSGEEDYCLDDVFEVMAEMYGYEDEDDW